ncbi:MAG: hypothetical protein LBQ03_01075 [Puniceicoccales bacterium]|nr:hypothetical protein [Puniceicoccales bacterium]
MIGMAEGQAKQKSAWAYAYVTATTYGSTNSKAYGAAQTFEYTSVVNKNYIDSIAGDDTVARNYGQALYNALTSNGNNRQSNWNKLKQDSLLEAITTKAINAQLAVAEALKNIDSGGNIARAQAALQEAIQAVWNFITSSEQNRRDYENAINAYKAVDDYFLANPGRSQSDGPNIFKNNLNGTAANSYGAMAASILMSLDSTQNVLDAYLSGK